MCRVHDRPAAQVERPQLGGGIAGVESRQAPSMPLPDQHDIALARPELERSLDRGHRQHARSAGLDGIGGRRERTEHVDDDRRPAGCPGTRNVIEYLDDQLVPAERLIGTMRARGMKLKSVAVAAV